MPIIVDKDGVIVAGHTRLKAAEKLGLDEVPVIVADDLTPEQVKAFRLADNKVGELADWDFDKLDEELAELGDFDMGRFSFDLENKHSDFKDRYNNFTKGALQDKFIIPPFSVFDTKAGYWQDRKRKWLEKTGNLSETRNGEFGKLGASAILDEVNDGTSNFDPVLAEIIYKWFCVPGGKILDPFGGEQTKGVVAGELGFQYTAVEFRQDQVDLNKSKTNVYPAVTYICGDSNNIKELIKDRGFDLCFTSPPYYDLEVYSKDDMSALGTYEEFMQMYENIFKQCYDMIADDSFLVVKVGEIRNKKTGEYRSFVADNVKLFTRLGFKFYNDIVLLNMIGTSGLRANNLFRARKIVKTHQNILVFYKGDLKNIKEKFTEIDFSEVLQNENFNFSS